METQPRELKGKSRTGFGCLLGLVIFLSIAFVVLLLGLAAMAAMRGSLRATLKHGHARMGADEYPELTEVWSCGAGETKVVAVPLTGMIMLGGEDGGLFSGPSSTEMALMSIRRATHDKEVRALILRVDSGGGGITASDILYKALLDFKAAAPDRRVVAVFGDVAASGAYYVSLAADHIVAHPTTLTGSIGVLVQTINARELAAKIGIKDVTIKSGANKDLLNPLGDMTDQQRAMLQALVDELHDRFVTLVAEGRRLPPARVRELADGRIFSAGRAKDAGLVDSLGYWEDGVRETARLLGVEDVKVFRYEQAFSLSALLRAAAPEHPLRALLRDGAQTRLLYRWPLQ